MHRKRPPGISSYLKVGTHYPCSRARTRPVNWGIVYRPSETKLTATREQRWCTQHFISWGYRLNFSRSWPTISYRSPKPYRLCAPCSTPCLHNLLVLRLQLASSPLSVSQIASRSVQPFWHSLWQRVPIRYNGRPLSPQNCPFPWGILNSMLYMAFWVHSSPQPKRHLDRFRRFCRAH